jgi:two-component system phosphate regulon sensor histidine kinase PhoR
MSVISLECDALKKRIFTNFLGLVLLCVLLLSVSVSIIIFNVNKTQEKAAVMDRAVLAADLLNKGVSGSRFTDYSNFNAGTARITVIAPDGTVLLDNKVTAAAMDNHSGREEFIQALQTGSGEATRFSHTQRTETYYYAVRLDDGNVLRVSKIMSNINGAISAVLPAIFMITFFVLLIAVMVARRLTKNIIYPLNSIDFNGDNYTVYDELEPYLKKIEQQKNEIAAQINALKSRTEIIDVITSSMREGLILIGKKGVVRLANNSAAAIFRNDRLEQMNILHICRNAEFHDGVKQCLSGGTAEIIHVFNNKYYTVYFSPVQNESGLNGGVILFFDITERHKTEQQRREFSANVSHELKTPLTGISAYSEMIEHGIAKEEDIKSFAAKISEQAKRLIDIINDIIKLSEFDENKAEPGKEIFDLYALAESAADTLRNNVKGVTVSITGEHFDISANRRMIDELLFNLIDNGIKYNKDGGSVTVALSRENGMCKIAVSDTGIGIPQEHRGRVFERFYRVDKSRSKKTGGTGLGLSIVKHIAEHHGGHAEAESTGGEGTTVICRFSLGV